MAQRPALMLALVLFGSVHGQQQHQQQPGFGAAKRVVVIGIDGCRADLIGSAVAPTLQRLVAKGASTTSARALLPTLSLPNWSGILTGSSPSETAITWNGWRRSTARSPPVGLPPRTPPASAPWVPNMLEVADAAGVDVSAFHDWAPLNRILSPEFVERAVQWGNCTTLGDEWEELAGGPCGTQCHRGRCGLGRSGPRGVSELLGFRRCGCVCRCCGSNNTARARPERAEAAGVSLPGRCG